MWAAGCCRTRDVEVIWLPTSALALSGNCHGHAATILNYRSFMYPKRVYLGTKYFREGSEIRRSGCSSCNNQSGLPRLYLVLKQVRRYAGDSVTVDVAIQGPALK